MNCPTHQKPERRIPRKPRTRASCRRSEISHGPRPVVLLFSLIVASLLVNFLLCVLGLADSHSLTERLGAVLYTGCGALIKAVMDEHRAHKAPHNASKQKHQ
jgi:hypothetical protein